MARILVTEKIAESGLDELRAAGHDVDVRLGLSPEELLEAVPGAAALAAVSGDLEAVAMMRLAFDRRRRRIHAMLNEIPGVSCLEPQGAFYAFPSFQDVLGQEIAGRRPGDTLELAEVLLEEVRVAIVPGEAFGAPGYARLSFACGDDSIGEGIARIAKLLAG